MANDKANGPTEGESDQSNHKFGSKTELSILEESGGSIFIYGGFPKMVDFPQIIHFQ